MYTLPCLKGKSSKALLFGTGGSAQCFLAAWTGGEFGGERTHMCVWLSPFAVHQKLSQHCSLAIPRYKIKRFFVLFLNREIPLKGSIRKNMIIKEGQR